MTHCTHFGICGGCVLQDMPPADYAAHKQAVVEAALAKVGVKTQVLAPLSLT